MIPKFKRVLHLGMKGSDVKAMKIGLKRAGFSSGIVQNRRFGPAARTQLKRFQKHAGLQADGVYGAKTHEKVAPHFNAYARWLYRRAPAEVDVGSMTAAEAAQKLIAYHAAGRYRDDNGYQMAQIAATARGQAVRNQGGQYVHIDARVLRALVHLIQRGWRIGTFALCSDHRYDGPHGHYGGHAVDISSINGVLIASNSASARLLTLNVARHIHSSMPSGLGPWQEICDGYGYVHDPSIAAETIPSTGYYGAVTMSQHRNHIHLGYF